MSNANLWLYPKRVRGDGVTPKSLRGRTLPSPLPRIYAILPWFANRAVTFEIKIKKFYNLPIKREEVGGRGNASSYKWGEAPPPLLKTSRYAHQVRCIHICSNGVVDSTNGQLW